MNALQNTILEIIFKIANVPGAFDYGDDVLYGLKNYIARHSLANNEYYVSENALASFPQHELLTPLRRNKIGKLKAFFTFEHPVPASLVARQIKNSGRTIEEISKILSVADCVTLVTKEDDRKMSLTHHSKMPEGWVYFTHSSFARYDICEVKICDQKILVFGSLVR